MIQIFGPRGWTALNLTDARLGIDLNDAWLYAFLRDGYSSKYSWRQMRGREYPVRGARAKVTRTIWSRVTGAMRQTGLLAMQRGTDTQVLFAPPYYPILYGRPHPLWDCQGGINRTHDPATWGLVPLEAERAPVDVEMGDAGEDDSEPDRPLRV